mmetsp:Transcript_5353/g.15295  ORF Transcript_5353/g.15295 Transcript_5353/m.15295 type:complete len:1028 (-) Transcript_5353:102-3185(-)
MRGAFATVPSLIVGVFGLACNYEFVADGVRTCLVNESEDSAYEEHRLSYNGNILIEASLTTLGRIFLDARESHIQLRSKSLLSAPTVALFGDSISATGLAEVSSELLVMYATGNSGIVAVDDTCIVRASAAFVGASGGLVDMVSAEADSVRSKIFVTAFSFTDGGVSGSASISNGSAPTSKNMSCQNVSVEDGAVLAGATMDVGSSHLTLFPSTNTSAATGLVKVGVQLGDLKCGKGGISCEVGVLFGGASAGEFIQSSWTAEFPSFPMAGGFSGMCLAQCEPGSFGHPCRGCPVGKFGTDGELCWWCKNAPTSGEYTDEGWHTAECPYRCGPEMPNVVNNPKCLGAVDYILSVLGGKEGVFVISISFFFFFFFLLFRRRSARKRQFAEEFAAGTQRAPSSFINPMQASTSFHSFSKELLPFHVTRVYLFGRNDFERPWGVDCKLPADLNRVVNMHHFKSFAEEASMASKVRRGDRKMERLLKILHVPLGPLYAERQRKARAKRLKELVLWYCEGINRRPAIWSTTATRYSGSDFSMSFGSDQCATLGFLDFFDFKRDQLDWTPTPRQQEGRILVAHGYGTFNNPFAIDIACPLVQHLTSGLGPAAVYSVISTFNRVARLMTIKDVVEEPPSVQYLRLLHTVHTCAVQCGVSGLVRVCRIVQPAQRTMLGGSSYFLSLDPEMTPHHHLAKTFMAPAGSYAPSTYSSTSTAVLNQHVCRTTVDVKLCLTLAERSDDAFQRHFASPRQSVSVQEKFGHSEPITTPMQLSTLAEHMCREETTRETSASFTELRYRADSEGTHRLSVSVSRLMAYLAKRFASTATSLLLLTLSIFADCLLACLVTVVLLGYRVVLGIWILCPPLAQLTCLILGPLFVIFEEPWLGRLYFGVQVSGAVQVVITLMMLAVLQRQSLPFLILLMLVFVGVKGILAISTMLHIRFLDNLLDLRFMSVSQVDFLEGIFKVDRNLHLTRPSLCETRSGTKRGRGTESTSLTNSTSTCTVSSSHTVFSAGALAAARRERAAAVTACPF